MGKQDESESWVMNLTKTVYIQVLKVAHDLCLKFWAGLALASSRCKSHSRMISPTQVLIDLFLHYLLLGKT
jgi:hypothetical protein